MSIIYDMADKKKSFAGVVRVFTWTVMYVAVMWMVLRWLFNFDMLSVAHWIRLGHVQLHGFAGLVFGIFILAAVPLYVATTALVVRNKQFPISIPRPACMVPVPPVKEEPVIVPIVTEQEALPELRPGIPQEMREIFMRAQKNYGVRQRSVFNQAFGASRSDAPLSNPVPEMSVVPAVDTVNTDAVDNMGAMAGQSRGVRVAPIQDNGGDFAQLPVPSDFDVASSDNGAGGNYDIPVFSDVLFRDEDGVDDADDDTDATVGVWGGTDGVVEILRGNGLDASVSDDLILVGKYAVAVHDDDDFWVADDIDWFAAGRVRPSPIVKLTDLHAANGCVPVLFVAEQNIMDFDSRVAAWQSAGVTVVTDMDDLIKLLNQ